MGHRLALSALLVTAAVAWPASAFAATGQLSNEGTMIYSAADDGAESNTVTLTLQDDGFGNLFYVVVDQPAVTIAAEPPCENGFNGEPNVMKCPTDGANVRPPPVRFSASLGDGDDTITLIANLPTSIGAGGGTDTMRGGPADDALRGGQGADNIDGSSGNDTIIGDDPVDPNNPATLQGGNDTISGGLGNDTIDGEAGADDLRGYLGDDTLNGGDGNDVMRADFGADGADVVNGGDGVDTATYDESHDPLTLSLDDQPNDGPPGSVDNIHADVENLIGGAGNDALSGSGQPNSLDGGPGNDTESGGDGDDAVDGADGNDNLGGDAGSDSVNGGAGDDTVNGGTGADSMNGGDGVDLADYSSRAQGVAVQLDDVPGDGEFGENDNVHADVENVGGGGGPDTLIGSGGANALDGGSGEDYSDGGPGADTLTGGDAGDVLRTRGSADPDTIDCGPGPDFVVAKANDVIGPDCDRADRGVNQKPKRRDSAIVTPLNGSLQMSPTGIVRRVPLQDKVVLPLRSIVDTVTGQVKVASAPTARRLETVTLEDGAFDITQTSAKTAITQFALQGGDFSVCPTAAGRRASAAAGKKASTKTIRTLWASGKGKFRTKGRYASATIRGTKWQTVDRCDGTLIRVERGAVSVRDTVKKKTVVVKAGDSYVAKR